MSCHERNPKVCGLTRPHIEIRIFFFIARDMAKKTSSTISLPSSKLTFFNPFIHRPCYFGHNHF